MDTQTRIQKKSVLGFVISLSLLLSLSSFVYGGEWSSVTPPSVSSNWWLNGVYFTSSSDGWAVGGDGTNGGAVLLRYSTGTWTSVAAPSISSNWWLNGVHFTSGSEGWVVGMDLTKREGALLHYSGSTWTSEAPPSVSSDWCLLWVHFTSASEGWAVGGDYTNGRGVLLYYSGGTWTLAAPLSVEYVAGVYFSSPGEGWAVGYDNQAGVLLRYSDPVSSLSVMNKDTSGNLLIWDSRNERITKVNHRNGSTLWEADCSVGSDPSIHNLIDSKGDVVVGGILAGDRNSFIRKYSGKNGLPLWGVISPVYNSRAPEIYLDHSGNVFSSSTDGAANYIAKYSSNSGAVIWKK